MISLAPRQLQDLNQWLFICVEVVVEQLQKRTLNENCFRHLIQILIPSHSEGLPIHVDHLIVMDF